MTTENAVEIVATGLEIAAFFFVTLDLYGKSKVEKATESYKQRTMGRFDRFARQFAGESYVPASVVRSMVFTLAVCLVCIAIAAFSIVDFLSLLATPHSHAGAAGTVVNRADSFWELMGGQSDATFQQTVVTCLTIVVRGLLYLFVAVILLVGTVMTLSIISILLYFAVLRILFWRGAPERGLLMIGAALFILSKLMSLTARTVLASHAGTLPLVWIA